jgi:hypothetical protein
LGLIALAELASLLVETAYGLISSRAKLDGAYESIWEAFESGAFRDGNRAAILFVNAGTGAWRLTDAFIAKKIPPRLDQEGRTIWHQVFLSESFTTSGKAAEFLASRGIDMLTRFSEQMKNARRISTRRKRLLSERRQLTKPRRGPVPTVSKRVEQEMRTDCATEHGRAYLEAMKDIELHAKYKAAPSTCKPIRRRLLREQET